MRLSQLHGARVVDADGYKLGRAHEIHAAGGAIDCFVLGEAGFLERMTGKTRGRQIPWSKVAGVTHGTIVLKGD